MTLRHFLCVTIAGWLLAGPDIAYAVSPDIGIAAPGVVTVDYDPFEGADGTQSVEFSVLNSSGNPQEVLLDIRPEFDTAFQMEGTGHDIPFLVEAGALSRAESFRVPLFIGLGETTHEIALRIPSGSVPDAGTAEQELVYQLLDPQTLEPLTALETLSARASIPARAQTNFAGATPGFSKGVSNAVVDFGEIERGAERRIVLQVRANTEAAISISSENGGAMVAGDGAQRIAYSLDVDGEGCDLEVGCDLARNPERTLDGSAYDMEFRVDEDASLFAGEYRDVVTVEVNPL